MSLKICVSFWEYSLSVAWFGGSFVSKPMKFCKILLISTLCFHLSIFPLTLGGKVKIWLKSKKQKNDHFSLHGALYCSGWSPDLSQARCVLFLILPLLLLTPVSYQDLYWPDFRWLGCSDSFWYLFRNMGIVVSHLDLYNREILCHYHILLYLIGQTCCLQGSYSKHSKQSSGSRLLSWRWIWQLEQFSCSVSNQGDL